MRILLAFFLSLFLLSTASAQKVLIESGVLSGESDFQCGMGVINKEVRTVGFMLGRQSPITESLDLAWGLRYNTLSCGEGLVYISRSDDFARFDTTTKQHYLSIPVHLQIPVHFAYMVFGPELGFLVSAREVTEIEDTANSEVNKREVSSSLTRLNLMLTLGVGRDFKVFSKEFYGQLNYSRTMLEDTSHQKSFLSGFNSVMYVAFGVKL